MLIMQRKERSRTDSLFDPEQTCFNMVPVVIYRDVNAKFANVEYKKRGPPEKDRTEEEVSHVRGP